MRSAGRLVRPLLLTLHAFVVVPSDSIQAPTAASHAIKRMLPSSRRKATDDGAPPFHEQHREVARDLLLQGTNGSRLTSVHDATAEKPNLKEAWQAGKQSTPVGLAFAALQPHASNATAVPTAGADDELKASNGAGEARPLPEKLQQKATAQAQHGDSSSSAASRATELAKQKEPVQAPSKVSSSDGSSQQREELPQQAAAALQAASQQAGSVATWAATEFEAQLARTEALTQCMIVESVGSIGCAVNACPCGMMETCYRFSRQLGNATSAGKPVFTNIGVCDYKPSVFVFLSLGLMAAAFIVFSLMKMCAKGSVSAHLYICVMRNCPMLLPKDWPPPKAFYFVND